MPSFLVVCTALPFLTLSTCKDNGCQEEEHDKAGTDRQTCPRPGDSHRVNGARSHAVLRIGASSVLFMTNAVLLGVWCLAFATAAIGRQVLRRSRVGLRARHLDKAPRSLALSG